MLKLRDRFDPARGIKEYMETSLVLPSLPMLTDCATTCQCQWHTASFMAGTTRVDWKLTLTEEGAKRFPLLYFFIVLTLPVVFKREIG